MPEMQLRFAHAVLFRVKGYGLSSVKKNELFRVKGCGVSSVKKNEVFRVKQYILSSVKTNELGDAGIGKINSTL